MLNIRGFYGFDLLFLLVDQCHPLLFWQVLWGDVYPGHHRCGERKLVARGKGGSRRLWRSKQESTCEKRTPKSWIPTNILSQVHFGKHHVQSLSEMVYIQIKWKRTVILVLLIYIVLKQISWTNSTLPTNAPLEKRSNPGFDLFGFVKDLFTLVLQTPC